MPELASLDIPKTEITPDNVARLMALSNAPLSFFSIKNVKAVKSGYAFKAFRSKSVGSHVPLNWIPVESAMKNYDGFLAFSKRFKKIVSLKKS
jgi:hypothetical protein